MAVREFRDPDGMVWRTWCVTPDQIHPATKAEDYLKDFADLGWVVFERNDGAAKRRLCPIPKDWAECSDAELVTLMARADIVPASTRHRERQASPDADPAARAAARTGAGDGPPDLADLPVVRSFRYPGGRLWTVFVVEHPQSGAAPVLRFQAGSRSIDATAWPTDWLDYPTEGLAVVLRSAAPRREQVPPPGAPRRRYNDDARA